MTSYAKDPAFIVKEQTPFNGEPPPDVLRQSFITPTPVFYARNHGTIPEVDLASYHLQVSGLVEKPLALTLDDLRRQFPQHTVTATLQCAGNRRQELTAVSPIPGELPWGAAAIGTAVWQGAPLREVLAAAGVRPEAQHAVFAGLDEVQRQGKTFGFGGSVPLEKAAGPEVLLAYEMNGEPLTAAHGFPLRVVIPGYIGARSVKWVAEIRVQQTPSDNYFYTHAYQLFPPQARADSVDWSSGIKLGEMPVNSVICSPQEGERISGSTVQVLGYAVSGGGRRIERVDVSIDGGETWTSADLGEEKGPWAWRFWEAELNLPPGPAEIVARAWDSAANTQPDDVRQVWNFKGYVNNAWHRVWVVQE